MASFHLVSNLSFLSKVIKTSNSAAECLSACRYKSNTQTMRTGDNYLMEGHLKSPDVWQIFPCQCPSFQIPLYLLLAVLLSVGVVFVRYCVKMASNATASVGQPTADVVVTATADGSAACEDRFDPFLPAVEPAVEELSLQQSMDVNKECELSRCFKHSANII